jgi:hypothetical protein
MRNVLLAGIAALIAVPALAQDEVRARIPRLTGTIEQVGPQSFTVREDSGEVVTVKLDQGSRVVSNTPLTPDQIRAGDHISSDLMKGPDGAWHSTVGHTLSQPFTNDALWLRPLGGGRPGAMRILGLVEAVQKTPQGAHLKIKYDMGILDVDAPSGITLYHLNFDGRAILKPMMAVSAITAKAPDGTITGRFITVEKNGVKPIDQ